jgi:hypothetical protein
MANVIVVRVTLDELVAFKQRASELNLSVSELVRQLVLGDGRAGHRQGRPRAETLVNPVQRTRIARTRRYRRTRRAARL